MDTRILVGGLGFPESPRWHDGRLYFSDWAAGRVHAVSPDGVDEVVATGSSFPMCIDFLPDGRLLVVHGRELRVLDGGVLVPYADLSGVAPHDFNDITVGRDGTVYVNSVGFDFMDGEEPRPGVVAAVTGPGRAHEAATGVMFPNGMALLGDTLLVAESYGERITAFDVGPGGTLDRGRPWAQTPGHHPDGICVTPEGTVWYADVATGQCVEIAAGGARRRTVQLDRGAFACALGDGVLYVTANTWGEGFDPSAGNGTLVAVTL